MKARPISWDEIMAVRRLAIASLSPSIGGRARHTRSLTNSRMASATLGDDAIAATHEAKDDPVPSALSHIARKASTVSGPGCAASLRVLLHLAGVEGQCHGRHEEVGLALEIVVDQRRIDGRGAGDRP